MDNQPVKFCPFCGADGVKASRYNVLSCAACRTNFLLSYSRKLRAAPKPKTAK